MEKLLWQYRLPYKTQFEIKSAEQIWNVMGGVDEGERYLWVYLHQTKKYDTIICRTWLSAVFMENYWNTALNHSHTQTHTHTHTHTHSLFLSLSSFVVANNDAIHSFLRPIRGVYQFPWQLCSDWHSFIPGNITVAAKTIPKNHKKTCGATKCLSHCLVSLCRKNNTRSHISLTTRGHIETKCGPLSIWLHFN